MSVFYESKFCMLKYLLMRKKQSLYASRRISELTGCLPVQVLPSAWLVLVAAGSAIRTKQCMPRRLPEKNRQPKRRPRRFRGRRYRSAPIFQSAPVKEGQEIDLVIDDIGSRGDGVSRIQGYLIFVPRSKIGERVHVRIVKVNRKFAIAEKID